MAKHRENISRPVRRQLVREAGSKCANPGCTNYRVHIHHIMEWAIYATNDPDEMIAICPSCHDTVHHGDLEISDETLRQWKGNPRPPLQRDLLHVDASPSAKLLLGSIAVTGDERIIVFDLSPNNALSFRLEDDELMLVNLELRSTSGNPILTVRDNRVKYAVQDPVQYRRRPGKVRVEAPIDEEFIPAWALDAMRIRESGYAAAGTVPLLDLEVIEPGHVRAQGVWLEEDHGVIVSEGLLCFVRPGWALGMAGEGANSVLHYTGPITKALFNFS